MDSMTWTSFKTRQGQNHQVAVHGKHRYSVSSCGYLTVTMKYGDVALVEGKMRAATNARSYAAEIAQGGGPA